MTKRNKQRFKTDNSYAELTLQLSQAASQHLTHMGRLQPN